MKKLIFVTLAIFYLLAGCSKGKTAAEIIEPISATASTEQTAKIIEPISATTGTEQAVAESKIFPLPDTTMDNLSDATLSISLEEGDAYVDDTGKMQMDIKIYSYDKYDMVDISMLKVGDILVTHTGEVEITSLDTKENGTILINGGLDENGFDLITDETGVFYEGGYNNTKNWYEIGEATIRVSTDFVYHDTSDLEAGETLYYPGSFLVGEVTDYNLTPYNTTIRVENSQIIEMHRVYTP